MSRHSKEVNDMSMNTNYVFLTGRLTREPEIRYTTTPEQLCIAKFSLAVNRGKDKAGADKGCDYIPISCCGKNAEAVEKYVKKGSFVIVSGMLASTVFEKNGKKTYGLEVKATRVEFPPKAKTDDSFTVNPFEE